MAVAARESWSLEVDVDKALKIWFRTTCPLPRQWPLLSPCPQPLSSELWALSSAKLVPTTSANSTSTSTSAGRIGRVFHFVHRLRNDIRNWIIRTCRLTTWNVFSTVRWIIKPCTESSDSESDNDKGTQLDSSGWCWTTEVSSVASWYSFWNDVSTSLTSTSWINDRSSNGAPKQLCGDWILRRRNF